MPRRRRGPPPTTLHSVPCPRCKELARDGLIRVETVQPLPEGAWAPLARDGSGRCCADCAAADAVIRLGWAPNFLAARIAVGNDRQEQYRMPGFPVGVFVNLGLMARNAPGDLERHHQWLDQNRWFGFEASEEP